MKKEFNQNARAIDIRSDNFKDERILEQAVKDGLLEKVTFGTWRLRA